MSSDAMIIDKLLASAASQGNDDLELMRRVLGEHAPPESLVSEVKARASSSPAYVMGIREGAAHPSRKLSLLLSSLMYSAAELGLPSHAGPWALVELIMRLHEQIMDVQITAALADLPDQQLERLNALPEEKTMEEMARVFVQKTGTPVGQISTVIAETMAAIAVGLSISLRTDPGSVEDGPALLKALRIGHFALFAERIQKEMALRNLYRPLPFEIQGHL